MYKVHRTHGTLRIMRLYEPGRNGFNYAYNTMYIYKNQAQKVYILKCLGKVGAR